MIENDCIVTRVGVYSYNLNLLKGRKYSDFSNLKFVIEDIFTIKHDQYQITFNEGMAVTYPIV